MSEENEIAAWLRAQAQSDISRAELAGGGEWRTGCECEGECRDYPQCERVEGADITIYAEGGHDADQARHIAAHDPRTGKARAESVLEVLDEYEAAVTVAEKQRVMPGGVGPGVGACVRTLSRTVRLLARGYRCREGYAETWKP